MPETQRASYTIPVTTTVDVEVDVPFSLPIANPRWADVLAPFSCTQEASPFAYLVTPIPEDPTVPVIQLTGIGAPAPGVALARVPVRIIVDPVDPPNTSPINVTVEVIITADV